MSEASRPDEVARTKNRTLAVAILTLLVSSIVAGAVLLFGLLPSDAAFHFSEIAYVILPAGAGVALIATSRTLERRRRVAWSIIGLGVLAWGLGEIIWVYYEYVLGVEVPYPGWADVFYILGYPLMFVGVLLLPHVKPGRLERLRLTLDAISGSLAIAAIMWVAYLSDQIYIDPELGFLEQFVNIMYPVGDVFLLIALMILAVRRSSLRFDVRLIVLSLGVVATAIADIIYVLQVENDTYIAGGWLDAVWLFSYGGFVAAGWYLLQGVKQTEQADRATSLWQVATPYTVVMILFALTLFDMSGDASVLQIASATVGLLIIARQAVSIRENRELVEKQRDDLIASISHELRTPLTSLQGFAELLNRSGDQLGAEQRDELTEIIERQSRHLGGIVTDLVDVARDELASTNLTLEILDLADIVADASAMLPQSVINNAEVAAETPPDLRVNADRRRLTQVIVNLLSNACRYGDGRVRIEAHATDKIVTIRVHDNGAGVPKRHEEAIWERFERGAHRFDATVPGSGIGLPIARALAEAHGGTLAYSRSEALGGACFTLMLPAVRTEVATAVSHEPVPAR